MLALFLLTCSSLVLGGQISTGGCAATSSCGKGTSSYNYCYVASTCASAMTGFSGYYDYCTPATITVACSSPNIYTGVNATLACSVTTSNLTGTLNLQWLPQPATGAGSASTIFSTVTIGLNFTVKLGSSSQTTLTYNTGAVYDNGVFTTANTYTLNGVSTAPFNAGFYIYATADDFAVSTVSANSNLLSANGAFYCPSGQYSDGATTVCTSCPTGYSSTTGSNNIGQASCTSNPTNACGAGYYSSSGSCASCAAGYYSPAGSSKCSICAAGSYSSINAANCSTCLAGTYSASSASSSCATCAAHYFSQNGATSCSRVSKALSHTDTGLGIGIPILVVALLW